MIKNRDSLKAKISKLVAKTNISNKYIIQTFMFEALLKRISVSEYKDKFIIKGGLLLSSIFGVNLRSTMDLDTTLRNLPLTEEKITEAVEMQSLRLSFELAISESESISLAIFQNLFFD